MLDIERIEEDRRNTFDLIKKNLTRSLDEMQAGQFRN